MASYDNPYAQPMEDAGAAGYAPPQPKMSGLAVASLVCSLFICCPIVTLIGPLLGLSAIISISANPAERRGKGLAIAGIIIGILTTALWAAGIYFGAQLMRGAGEFVTQEVPAAFDAGYDDKFLEFRAVLSARASRSATDDEIRQFLADLESRYGPYVGMRLPSDMSSYQGSDDGLLMPMEFEFEGGRIVDAELLLILEELDAGGWRLDSLTIPDPTLGPITFP